MTYDPTTARFLCFAKAREAFRAGEDSPRAYLERCLERIAQREPEVHAFVSTDFSQARREADAATARWRAGRPLSAVDGLPFAVKDCFDLAGMPTQVNSPMLADNMPPYDAAHVHALRRGGAIALGKTVSTELTMAAPGPTRNPWDLGRTPGGSSSGSAAAVADGMLPVASGSQVRGSILRPASICGVIGMKPTYGAVNRLGGFDPSPSLNHLGFLGGTLIDLWEVTHHVAAEVGGDPGCTPFAGGPDLPAPSRPLRVLRQYTAGWEKTDAASKEQFEKFLDRLRGFGVTVIEPEDGELRAYEEATTRVPEFFFDLMLWESRWHLEAGLAARPGSLGPTILGYIERARKLTLADYRRALAAREALREQHRALKGRIDLCVTLAHIGPGQVGSPAVGTPWYNDASSAIGAPTFSLPLLAVDGLPLGIQVMGFEHEDEALAAQARWLLEAFGSNTVA